MKMLVYGDEFCYHTETKDGETVVVMNQVYYTYDTVNDKLYTARGEEVNPDTISNVNFASGSCTVQVDTDTVHYLQAENLTEEIITLYAFSTENWKRPQHEVDALMGLISSYIDELLTNLPPVRIRFIGDKSPLSPELCEKIREIEGKTAHYPRTLNIAVNYGGRAELCHAFNALIAEGKQEVTEDDISAHLYTAPIPDPDLIIRTGGDKRTSNFLLWQAAYAELAFTKTLWPDFTERELFAILKDFCKRHRRFGGL
jgi:undecaprenyl diphosphate synthase